MSRSRSSVAVVWFRQDLRLADNPALRAAIDDGHAIVPLFILDDATPGEWAPGAASRWWLHHSLSALQADIEKAGARFVLRKGRASDLLPKLARQVDATAVYWNEHQEPFWRDAETDIAGRLQDAGVEVCRYPGNVLFSPGTITTKKGEPYRVFTPFWNACLHAPEPPQPLPRPRTLPPPKPSPKSDNLSSWKLPNRAGDLDRHLGTLWQPGEQGANARLREFMRGALHAYEEHRDRPDLPGTSRLSPHLHFGEISARHVWHAVGTFAAQQGGAALERNASAFLRELGWREFSIQLLATAPDLPVAPLRQEFANFPWAGEEAYLQAWRDGRTGYPIVDAGMRELRETGWMHNRVRMIVASFLIKDLLIPWQRGEAWFWGTLVDADLANNAASWQWVAGCGADAAPFFRIFNPVKQGQKFDPDGAYTRRWVPEIAGLPNEHLHGPWQAPDRVLRDAGVETYPEPIVNHARARDRALAAFEEVKTAKS